MLKLEWKIILTWQRVNWVWKIRPVALFCTHPAISSCWLLVCIVLWWSIFSITIALKLQKRTKDWATSSPWEISFPSSIEMPSKFESSFLLFLCRLCYINMPICIIFTLPPKVKALVKKESLSRFKISQVRNPNVFVIIPCDWRFRRNHNFLHLVRIWHIGFKNRFWNGFYRRHIGRWIVIDLIHKLSTFLFFFST